MKLSMSIWRMEIDADHDADFQEQCQCIVNPCYCSLQYIGRYRKKTTTRLQIMILHVQTNGLKLKENKRTVVTT